MAQKANVDFNEPVETEQNEIASCVRSHSDQLRGIVMRCSGKDGKWFISTLKKGPYFLDQLGPYPTEEAARFTLEIISGSRKY